MAQGVVAVFGGGTGGDDVVYKKNMLILKAFGVAYGKDFFHIVHTGKPVFAGLCVGVTATVEVSGHDGYVHVLGHSVTEQFALVISALAFAAAMEWYGNKAVDVVESSRREQFGSKQVSILLCQGKVAVIFDLMDYGLGNIASPEKEQRSPCHVGDASGKA